VYTDANLPEEVSYKQECQEALAMALIESFLPPFILTKPWFKLFVWKVSHGQFKLPSPTTMTGVIRSTISPVFEKVC
jgi:hypothetical protein